MPFIRRELHPIGEQLQQQARVRRQRTSGLCLLNNAVCIICRFDNRLDRTADKSVDVYYRIDQLKKTTWFWKLSIYSFCLPTMSREHSGYLEYVAEINLHLFLYSGLFGKCNFGVRNTLRSNDSAIRLDECLNFRVSLQFFWEICSD
jgi:hypothetical protein